MTPAPGGLLRTFFHPPTRGGPMSVRLPERPLSASSVHAPAVDPDEAAAHRRTFAIIATGAIVGDLVVAGWLAFGPVDMPEETRWPIALLIVASGLAGLFVLRRIWRQRYGV